MKWLILAALLLSVSGCGMVLFGCGMTSNKSAFCRSL